jgi:hypothetical protein
MSRPRLWLLGAITAVLAVLAPAGPALSQPAGHPPMGAEGGPSSLPPGDGTIRGIIIDPENPRGTAGLDVALYALHPDGTPGIGATKVEADGGFAFTGISNDSAIVYLVVARYAEVPLGERTGFAPGQLEIDLALTVEQPTTDASGLGIAESTLRIEALGSRLAVQEGHTLTNSGSRPVYVSEGARAGLTPPFRARLPKGARDFRSGVFNSDEGFEQRGDEIFYWGPIYAGQQELRFSYQLPAAPGADTVSLEKHFPDGTGGVRVMTPEAGPRVESPDLRPGDASEIDGRPVAVFEGGAVAAGQSIRLEVSVPDTVDDPDAIRLGRVELSVELDDTVMEVTQTHQIEVAAGAQVAGTPDAPLLRFDLPAGADLVGISGDAEELGIHPGLESVNVIGPLGPGTHEFAFRYRIPAAKGATPLDLRFPLTVPTLLIRTADTGLVIESDRLHRLRPQAMGTRTWMMREAFHVEAGEVVPIRFRPLEQTGPSQIASVTFVFAASALILLFVVSPLRASSTEEALPGEDLSGPTMERSLLYGTIRDLEHDFETGKVAESDYEQTRAELRARAVDLMRQERETQPGATPLDAVTAAKAPAEEASAAAATSTTASTTPGTGGYCPACGGLIDPAWRFCSHCGGALSPPADSGAESAG